MSSKKGERGVGLKPLTVAGRSGVQRAQSLGDSARSPLPGCGAAHLGDAQARPAHFSPLRRRRREKHSRPRLWGVPENLSLNLSGFSYTNPE
jgi:hypothetical protein